LPTGTTRTRIAVPRWIGALGEAQRVFRVSCPAALYFGLTVAIRTEGKRAIGGGGLPDRIAAGG